MRRLQPSGGTNPYDALAQALRDPAVEVVYLLSDGSPTTGRYKAPAQILRAVDFPALRGRRVTPAHRVGRGHPGPAAPARRAPRRTYRPL
ncbi:MAG: hypothetical protein R3F62_17805 [Planctomycetota bacterium]